MIEQKVTVINETGIHARPADLLVKQCMKFKSKIEIVKDSKIANAKSILNILTLSLNKGVEITLRIDGEDEKVAMETLVEFINNLED